MAYLDEAQVEIQSFDWLLFLGMDIDTQGETNDKSWST